MYNIVNDFLCKNDIIYKNQFGLRKLFFFLDLKKAFDTVDHQIRIKLFSYGIRCNTLKWFQSYLTDRSQYVTYDGIE